MDTCILHVSDLHVGASDDPELDEALRSIAERVQPGLVIASGDLTHRGSAGQHARAAALLRALGPPVLAVPGNHDIPYTFPARFTQPWRAFEREWETTEPVHATPSVHAVGLNSVRPRHHQSGGVGDIALHRARERLAGAAPGALRVAVLHHQLTGAPWRNRKKPLARRGHALNALARAGAELIVGGHVHQAAVSERHEFEVLDEGAPGVVLSLAPGLGRPRPHRRGEARGCAVYRSDAESLTVETWIRGDEWQLVAERRFRRRDVRSN